MSLSYIICSTQRSGSSFICGLLEAAGVFGAPREWLVFLEYTDSALGDKERSLKARSIEEIVKEKIDQQKTAVSGDVTGWKIMWSTLMEVDKKLGSGARLSKTDVDILFGNPRYIYLERSDKIAQSISSVVASKTKMWHASSPKQVATLQKKKENISLENSEITERLKRILMHERQWEDFFSRHAIKPLRIIYEDFCRDPKSGISAIAEFLHIDMPERSAIFEDKIRFRKVGSTFEREAAKKYLLAMTAR